MFFPCSVPDWSLWGLIILSNVTECAKFEWCTCRAAVDRREIDEHEIPRASDVYFVLELEELVDYPVFGADPVDQSRDQVLCHLYSAYKHV